MTSHRRPAVRGISVRPPRRSLLGQAGLFRFGWLAATIVLASIIAIPHSPAAERPNIVWITAEDMSATLGCYGDRFANTPNLDRFATKCVRYTHAFATSPVCSPSRSCLINGVIASTQGTHPMRSVFPIPAEMRGFPALLRERGYYTSNNVKTDYNSALAKQITAASWNESSAAADWTKRAADQPFFAVFNLMTTHQSRTMVWPRDQFVQKVQSQLAAAEIHDPDRVPVPPYYPDTPVVRRTIARYYDCVSVMDKQVGEILDKLNADGLAEETIVFFYSDHGSGMPRHKRLLLDSGMHVPLLIHFPRKYRHLAPARPGGTLDRLVCFEDFGPTVLSLTGIAPAPSMCGLPFLGKHEAEPRDYVFGHRDRVDEVIDMARSVRDKRYLYLRNYMPHLSYNQPSAWVDESELSHEFYKHAASGTMTAAQRHFAGPSRPVEELYDCERDPLNLNNLAESETHHALLQRMRTAHRDHVFASRDLGFLPEIEQWRLTRDGNLPMTWAQTGAYRLPQIFEAASQVGRGTLAKIREGLSHQQPAIRYWSVVAMHAHQGFASEDIEALKLRLDDDSACVRIEAAAALARDRQFQLAFPALHELLHSEDTTVLLHAARAVEMIGQPAESLRGPMQDLHDRYQDVEGDEAWFIRFTTSAFLGRLQP